MPHPGPAPEKRTPRFTLDPGYIVVASCDALGGSASDGEGPGGGPVARKRYNLTAVPQEGVIGYAVGSSGEGDAVDTLFVVVGRMGRPVEVTSVEQWQLDLGVTVSEASISILASRESLLIASVENGNVIRLRSLSITRTGGIVDPSTYRYIDRYLNDPVARSNSAAFEGLLFDGTSPKLMSFDDYGRPYMFYVRQNGDIQEVIKYAVPQLLIAPDLEVG